MTNFWRRLFVGSTPQRPSGSACLMCGDCCRAFGGHLSVTKADLARWHAAGREDLLRRVNRLGWIWIDPDTGRRERLCPFLAETAERQFACSIHQLKPDICRAYPTLAHARRCLKGVFLRLLPLSTNLAWWLPDLCELCLA